MTTAMMQAWRIHAWGEPPLLEQIPVPAPGLGETLVRMQAAAVTHLDLTVSSGEFAVRPTLPYVGGVEGAGLVVASESHTPGSRVALRGGDLGMGREGAWAEYAMVPDAAARPIHPSLSPEVAASAFDPLTTAYVGLHEIARLGSWRGPDVGADREVVIVAGAAGAVGAAAVQLAQRVGARVIGLVARPERAADVPKGAEVVTLHDTDRLDKLARDRPGTLVFDTWGGQHMFTRTRWVRPGGRYAVVGYVHGAGVALDLPNWMFDDVALLAVNLIERSASAEAVIDELLEMVVDGSLHVNVSTYPMSACAEVLARLARGQVKGRAVLLPEASAQ